MVTIMNYHVWFGADLCFPIRSSHFRCRVFSVENPYSYLRCIDRLRLWFPVECYWLQRGSGFVIPVTFSSRLDLQNRLAANLVHLMCLHGFQIWPSRADLVMSKLDLFPYSDVPIYLCYYFTVRCCHNLFSPQGIFANILTRFSLVIRYSRTET